MRILRALIIPLYVGVLGCGGGAGNGAIDGGGDASPYSNVTAMTVTPPVANVNLTAGGTGTLSAQATFTVMATFTDGSTRDVTAIAFWSSSDLSVSVPAGLATASLPGSFTITATLGATSGSAQMNASFSS